MGCLYVCVCTRVCACASEMLFFWEVRRECPITLKLEKQKGLNRPTRVLGT